jgi:hypothetical protein
MLSQLVCSSCRIAPYSNPLEESSTMDETTDEELFQVMMDAQKECVKMDDNSEDTYGETSKLPLGVRLFVDVPLHKRPCYPH